MFHLSCAREGLERRKFPSFQCSTQPAIFRIFNEFPILSTPEQTTITCLFGVFLNTQKEREHHLCKLPELYKKHA